MKQVTTERMSHCKATLPFVRVPKTSLRRDWINLSTPCLQRLVQPAMSAWNQERWSSFFPDFILKVRESFALVNFGCNPLEGRIFLNVFCNVPLLCEGPLWRKEKNIYSRFRKCMLLISIHLVLFHTQVLA